jgi:perosamine synthetase
MRGVERILMRGSGEGGSEVAALEREFAHYVGARYAVAVSSGTAALHLALLAHGIGPGGTVLTSPLCLSPVASAISTTGAEAVLVDIDRRTFTISPGTVEAALAKRPTRREAGRTAPSALLAIDLFGHPCDMDALAAITEREQLALIDVAWESLGARYKGRPARNGRTACYSFQSGMAIDTGEGGMLATDDEAIAKAVRRLANCGCDCCGRVSVPGFNYRMTELTAALARAQLARLDLELDLRRHWAVDLCWELRNMEGLLPPVIPEHATPSWRRFALRLLPEYRLHGEELCRRLRRNGFDAVHHPLLPLHRHPIPTIDPAGGGDVPNVEEIAPQLVLLPLDACLASPAVEKLSSVVCRYVVAKGRRGSRVAARSGG